MVTHVGHSASSVVEPKNTAKTFDFTVTDSVLDDTISEGYTNVTHSLWAKKIKNIQIVELPQRSFSLMVQYIVFDKWMLCLTIGRNFILFLSFIKAIKIRKGYQKAFIFVCLTSAIQSRVAIIANHIKNKQLYFVSKLILK